MSFFFLQNGEQEGKISPVWGVGTSGRFRRMNMMEILYMRVCKLKNETFRNHSGNGGREDKGE
jgi:hypothetical protein